MFTRGEVVYADPDGGTASPREPVAIFTGEVLPQYAGGLDDRTVRDLLDELASEMGQRLEQEENTSLTATEPGHSPANFNLIGKRAPQLAPFGEP
jgi:hypothetical protein